MQKNYLKAQITLKPRLFGCFIMQAVLKTMGVEPVDEKTAINIASSHKRIPKEDTPLAWSIDQG